LLSDKKDDIVVYVLFDRLLWPQLQNLWWLTVLLVWRRLHPWSKRGLRRLKTARMFTFDVSY